MDETEDRPIDYDSILTDAPSRGLRHLPGLLMGAFRIVRSSAPAPFVVTTALQLMTGLLVAGQLLAVRLLLGRLLAGGHPSFGSLIVPLLLLTGAYGLTTFAN